MSMKSQRASPPIAAEYRSILRLAGTVDTVCFDLDGTLYEQKYLRIAMATRLARAHLTKPAKGYQVARILSAYVCPTDPYPCSISL